MEILFILIPVSLVLLGVALWGFFWAVRSGQFDDLDSPAYRVLMEEDKAGDPEQQGKPAPTTDSDRGDDDRT